MTKWNWSQVSSSTMEDLISIFKKSYFQRDAPPDIFFYFKLNFGALNGFKKNVFKQNHESLIHP